MGEAWGWAEVGGAWGWAEVDGAWGWEVEARGGGEVEVARVRVRVAGGAWQAVAVVRGVEVRVWQAREQGREVVVMAQVDLARAGKAGQGLAARPEAMVVRQPGGWDWWQGRVWEQRCHT